jgi:glycosyltransferase involved in cell wall biosynthesis
MVMLEILFWLLLFLIFWTYAGYYIFLRIVSLAYTHRTLQSENPIPVSVVITCHNEEKRIGKKLDNTLGLNYPKDMMEIVVVSDGSTDNTDRIVQDYVEKSGVRLIRIDDRHGKHYGQGKGIQATSTETVILSDATTFLDSEAVRMIVRNFADPAIGCVSGQDRVATASDESKGEGLYVRNEMKLRELESKVGSLVGVSGSFFAVRKSLCDAWVDDMSSDFYLPIVAATRGLRTISEPAAVGTYGVLENPKAEYIRKVRTVVHGLEVLFKFKYILNPFKYGGFAVQMFSHKLCRWLVPFCMIAVLLVNCLLLGSSDFYLITIALQLLFYTIAITSLLFERLRERQPFRIVGFFTMVNFSIMVAWYKYLTNQRYVVWDATRR